MLYKIAKPLVRFALRQFFREITISGFAAIEKDPVLIVCNHPNFALDSLLVVFTYERPLWFLAKSTLFQGKVLSGFLRSAHLIPVYRKQDAEDLSKNVETFQYTSNALQNGQGIVIFPEGVSAGERKLLPLKSGAARIALQAANENGFKLGLAVQPVGITYSDLERFRSSVTVTIGAPIPLIEFKVQYENNAIEAVRALTSKIEEGLKAVTVEIKEAQHRTLVEKIVKVFESRGSAIDDRERMHVISRNVEKLYPVHPQKARDIEAEIDDYLELSSIFSLEGGDSLKSSFGTPYMVVLVPLVIIGVLVNYLPYRMVGVLVNNRSKYPVDRATLKLAYGILLFPCWYSALGVLAALIFGSFLIGILSAIFCGVLGYLTNGHLPKVRLLLLSVLWPGRKNPIEVLANFRNDLIKELEALRVE